MHMKHALAACITPLLVSGCGGVPTEEAISPDALASHEQAIFFICEEGQSWERYWYSDATRTVEVGVDVCACGSYYELGEKGLSYLQTTRTFCTDGGGGGGGGGDPGDGCQNPSLNPPPGC